ncbi:MAG: NAD(+)/NADH kinase [Gammaproteobacteria bacterium]|nr:NAD(+)/NADH kinase [Gammaproteobacteria bacterium]MBQ0840592.1 NAD(+)/NADH kinase [Gammaproteobacteria bacterium]
MGSLGIIANPMSGRDSRRLTARAESVSHESKRNQISRIVVGAVATGCTRILAPYDPRRLVLGALENMNIGAEVEEIRNPITHSAEDTRQAVRDMKARGCDVIIVMGGDGTSRIVTQVWQDVVMMPLSTGTNNVFPMWIEPTIAGMAAGLVASGKLSKEETTDRAKLISVAFENGEKDIALVDALFLQGDRIGNFGPFEPEFMKTLILTRAEPDAVGMSPLGGLLCPASAADDFGVRVDFCGHNKGGRLLRAPVSPGLFRSAHILNAAPLPLNEATKVHGPGIIAYDGDRERRLGEEQSATITVERNGPWVINPQRTLQLAAERQLMVDLPAWVDPFDGANTGGCCGCDNTLGSMIKPA